MATDYDHLLIGDNDAGALFQRKFNEALAYVAGAGEGADADAEAAREYRDEARAARDDAEDHASTASAAADTATTRAGEAATSATQAQTARDEAVTAAGTAADHAEDAGESASDAAESASAAEGHAEASGTAAGTATAAADAAATSESNAATSASDASDSADAADLSAQAADARASDAETARDDAQDARDDAQTAATDAGNSATSAATSESNAAASAGDAADSQTAAAADAASALASRNTTIQARNDALLAAGEATDSAEDAEASRVAAAAILALVEAHGNGWTPTLAVVPDGERVVVQVLSWSGGTGTAPATGYFGSTGIVATAGEATNLRGAPGTGTGNVDSVNGVGPDGNGNVEIEIGDIPGLVAALAAAGTVQTVAGVSPVSGNVPLTAADVGADPAGTAESEVEMLGDSLAAVAYTGHLDDLDGLGSVGVDVAEADDAETARAAMGAVGTYGSVSEAHIAVFDGATGQRIKSGSGLGAIAQRFISTLTVAVEDMDNAANWPDGIAAVDGGMSGVTGLGAILHVRRNTNRAFHLAVVPGGGSGSSAWPNVRVRRLHSGFPNGVSSWATMYHDRNVGAPGQALLAASDEAAARTALGLATVASTGSYNDLGDKPEIPDGFSVGDILLTARDPGAGWLRCDGSVYLQSSYTALFEVLGLVGGRLSHVASAEDLTTSVAINDVAISAEGKYFAIVQGNSPYLRVGENFGGMIGALPNPEQPTGVANGVAISADGKYLAVAHNNSPYLTIYERDGSTFTKLPDPDQLPAGNGASIAITADGNYLALTHTGGVRVSIYERAGSTFTKLPDPDQLPTSAGTSGTVSISPDGTYLVLNRGSNPGVRIYERDGSTFTKLPDPAGIPSSSGRAASISANGDYLVVTRSNVFTPNVLIYRRAGSIFTQLPNPATLPASVFGVAISADGKYFAVVSDSSGISVYARTDITFEMMQQIGLNIGRAVAFSPSGDYLAVAYSPDGSFLVINAYSIALTYSYNTSVQFAVPAVPNQASNALNVDYWIKAEDD